jgi:hemoglobin
VKLHRYAERVTMAAKSTVLVVASLALALLAGPAKAEDKSLYQRLGGYDAIAAVSDEFIAQLTNDEQEKRFFIGFSTDSKLRIRQLLVDLVCKSSGGPCVYTGRDMKTAHAGAGITKADCDRSLKIFGEVSQQVQSTRERTAGIGGPAPALGKGRRRQTIEHDPEKACPGLDPGWTPVFRKDHAQKC